MQQRRLRRQPFSSWNRRERCLPSGAEWRIPCVVQKLKNPPKVYKVHTRVFPSSWRTLLHVCISSRLLSRVKWEWFAGWSGVNQAKALKSGPSWRPIPLKQPFEPEGCRCMRYRQSVCVLVTVLSRCRRSDRSLSRFPPPQPVQGLFHCCDRSEIQGGSFKFSVQPVNVDSLAS